VVTEFQLKAGMHVRHLKSVDSTNAEAMRLAASGECGPMWVWADVQLQGRGRHGRHWHSQAGNLYATLLLSFEEAPEEPASISLAAPLAVVSTLNCFLPGPVKARLKWPNDVLLAGRKAAGILVESATGGPGGRWVVALGCGLNIRHAPRRSRYGATSLLEHGAIVEPLAVLQELAVQMTRVLSTWDRGAGLDAIRAEWISHAEGMGQRLAVARGEGRLSGTFDGLAPSGALRLRLADGQVVDISAGEVISIDLAGETVV
jgi:BirA family biotin operon repressor/biotin-[acetyl-CoA-carboxylase] ligase